MNSRSMIWMSLFLSTTLLFQNCAESLPDQNAIEGDPIVNQNAEVLQFDLNTTEVNAGEALWLYGKGGKPPYSFYASGPASIRNGNQLQAGSSPGSVVLTLVDAVGTSVNIGIEIKTIVSGSGASCTTPWGQTITDGAGVVAYSAAQPAQCVSTSIWENCPAVVNSCSTSVAKEIRICRNGSLSGAYRYRTCTDSAGAHF